MSQKKFRPPRGFRDFPPEVMLVRKRVLDTIERVFQKYGFLPLETPIVEYWETLAGKYGDEAETHLIWRFQDPHSGEWYALRYDLTVPLARFVATNPVPLPFKRYHIGRVFRHERPGRGRFREFWQADADIVGSPLPEADAECVELTIDAFKTLGFRDFTLLLNDRRLLTGIFEEELRLGRLGRETVLAIFRAIDKLDKIGETGVRGELKKLGLSEAVIEKIMKIIGIRGDPDSVLSELSSKFGHNEKVKVAVEHLTGLLDCVRSDFRGHIRLDLALVRGLDYYTGPIWEVVLERVGLGSLAGGGRYDDLIRLYGGPDLPATGTSLGVERIIEAGAELGLWSFKRKSTARAYVIAISDTVRDYAREVVRLLRDSGVPAEYDLMRRKWRAQVEHAKKIGVEWLVFVGEKEKTTRTVTLHNTKTGEHFDRVDLTRAIELIRKQ